MDPATAQSHSGAPLILIVEGDLDTRVLYREYLRHAGFCTADAHDGHQALATVRELRPDAVLTEFALPGTDGFEFCRAVKASVSTRHIPVLAVTGRLEYLDAPDRFTQAGIAQVLVTPCSLRVIAEELQRLRPGAVATSVRF